MPSILTVDDWWNTVDVYWVPLLTILHRFLPMGEPFNPDGLSTDLLEPASITVQKLKEAKDRQLARYFFAAWNAAPDEPSIHRINGWHVLCDLLSEEWVFDEGKDE